MDEATVEKLADVFESALRGMETLGPAQLWKHLHFILDERKPVANVDSALQYFRKAVILGDPNSRIHRTLARYLRIWDFAEDPAWAVGTAPLTQERRAQIYVKLGVDGNTADALSVTTPIAVPLNEAVLIAEEHQKWYTDERKRASGSFYWQRYEEYLRTRGNWTADSIGNLDRATEKVIRCLSDPERSDAFAAKGLVVGYVQSGKTANFTALIAKAVDAGYRMVVVLAGTLDSLRLQTQRRLDKELCGQEQILRDAEAGQSPEYSGDKDWDRFTSYGALPSALGACDIRRITTSRGDYKGLGQGRDVLKLAKRFGDRPLNNRDNLRGLEARLIVIKKHPAVIRKLLRDIRNTRMYLGDVPLLVIDDESDQASVNTVDPVKVREGKTKKDRTSTNQEIVNLLKEFPRSQYVGYTATPAANALINPGDTLDLFPKDFIELLPRPEDYMGVADFHDFDGEFNPLDEKDVERLGFRSKKKAFVREIASDKEKVKLKEALDAFFLAGAIKLFRNKRNPGVVSVRHHTMLVHRASQQDAHEEDANLVREMFTANTYRKPHAIDRLWELWKNDFEPVSLAQEPGLARPAALDDLRPFLIEALTRFESNAKQVLVVNGHPKNKDDMPDFDKDDVWNILVGGAKLSRGYTVDGLTTTFFLRKTAAGDTLMQMGRWFGFRRGYRDLVRLYIGTGIQSGGAKTVDLYEMFESICMDEERFRKRIKIYSDENITPRQVPPLVPMGMLPPTQKNKMHFAEIRFENYGERSPESGRVARKPADRVKNVDSLTRCVSGVLGHRLKMSGIDDDNNLQSLDGVVYKVETNALKRFLTEYQWGTKESQFAGVINFLNGTKEASPEIDSWILVILRNPSSKAQWTFDGKRFGAFGRTAVPAADGALRYKVISESRHRAVARHLAGTASLKTPNPELARETRARQAVCLVYPTVDKNSKVGDLADEDITLGITPVFPRNSIKQRIDFQVTQGNRDLRDPKRVPDDPE
jgi:hypothetical protein